MPSPLQSAWEPVASSSASETPFPLQSIIWQESGIPSPVLS